MTQRLPLTDFGQLVRDQRNAGTPDRRIAEMIARKDKAFGTELQNVLAESESFENPDEVVRAFVNYRVFGNSVHRDEYGRNPSPFEVEDGFLGRLGASIQSVPDRFARSFGSPEIREGRQETSKGFDLADLPGDIADVAGTALPVGGALAGGLLASPTLATGLPGAAFTGAMGSAGALAGEEARQSIGRSLGVQENTLGVTGEQFSEARGAALSGLVQEVGGAAIGKTLGAAQKFVGERIPQRLINSLIKPGKGEFKFGKNPGRAIADEGIVASSADDLAVKVDAKMEEIGVGIETMIVNASAKSPTQIDIAGIIRSQFDDALKELSKLTRTKRPVREALENLRDDLLETYGNTVVPLGAWEAKKDIGKLIEWNAADVFASEKNRALWGVFDGIRSALDKSVKGLAKETDRYSELAAAKTALGRRLQVLERSNILGLIPAIGGGTAAGVGALSQGGDLKTVAKAAGAGALATKFLGTTLPKTAGAQLSKAIEPVIKAAMKLEPHARALLFLTLRDQFSSDDEQ